MWEAVLEAQQGRASTRSGREPNGRDVHYACLADVFARRGYGSLAKPYRHIESESRASIHGTGPTAWAWRSTSSPASGDVDITLEVGPTWSPSSPGLYKPPPRRPSASRTWWW